MNGSKCPDHMIKVLSLRWGFLCGNEAQDRSIVGRHDRSPGNVSDGPRKFAANVLHAVPWNICHSAMISMRMVGRVDAVFASRLVNLYYNFGLSMMDLR